MACLIRALELAVLSVSAATTLAAAPPRAEKPAPVVATIETTLATARPQIRQFAFDGDSSTFFASKQNPGSADHFTLVFDKAVKVKSIGVVTGRPDGSDSLEEGKLLVSADGKTFRDLAPFGQGKSQATLKDESIIAVRVQPGAKSDHHLSIREVTIESDPPVAVFKYPVEFVIDVADEPKMKDWAEKVARICTRAYPMINEELKSEGFKPPAVVTLALKTGYRGVAFASGGRMTGSVKYFEEHPDDVGAMVHETTHVVQHYNGRGNPGWLVEGISDYVRFFKFEPGKLGRINAARAHYNGSYRVTAAFLAFVTDKYDKQLVLKLNKVLRDGQYKKEIFKELTGKSLEELDAEWITALRR
jgi:hypothetical protein